MEEQFIPPILRRCPDLSFEDRAIKIETIQQVLHHTKRGIDRKKTVSDLIVSEFSIPQPFGIYYLKEYYASDISIEDYLIAYMQYKMDMRLEIRALGYREELREFFNLPKDVLENYSSWHDNTFIPKDLGPISRDLFIRSSYVFDSGDKSIISGSKRVGSGYLDIVRIGNYLLLNEPFVEFDVFIKGKRKYFNYYDLYPKTGLGNVREKAKLHGVM